MTDRLEDLARTRWGSVGRILVIVLGLCLVQVILYGPSLVGAKLLLPLDLLADPLVYLPRTPESEKITFHNAIRSDLVLFYEPERRFAVAELHAGRLPFWSPYRFAGAPCFRWSLSPVRLPGYLVASPVVLAWIQLLTALAAGTGAYLFFGHALGVGFWPAAIAAWCYSLSGAFIVWQGYSLSSVMCWLPWVLLAVDATVRRPFGRGGPALAVLTGIVMLGGAPDIGGQLLLASGIYALGRCIELYGIPRPAREWLAAMAMTGLAWGLGILVSAWLLWPLLEYAGDGARTVARSEGKEERPPGGWTALPEIVVPQFYGSSQAGSVRLDDLNLAESAAGAYAGLLATLFLAPLAWCRREDWVNNLIWIILGVVALGWSLNVPGLVDLLRLPGLNMMSHNRFVFVAALAILALAARGLDVLWNGPIARRWWFVLPVLLVTVLGTWCVVRAVHLPEPVASELNALVSKGPVRGLRDMDAVLRVQRTFVHSYLVAAGLCAVAMCGWGWLWFRAGMAGWLRGAFSVVLIAEMLWFGYGRSAQCDPTFYYPHVPILDRLARDVPGRIVGFHCLPANLAQLCGLRDVRGYDGVDPVRLVELLETTASADSVKLSYALTQWLTPRVELVLPNDCELSPVLNMLNVRYVIVRGKPPQTFKPDLQDEDYWVMVNRGALPRVFIPEHVGVVSDYQERLRRLSAGNFDPRRVAYVEEPVKLPVICRGLARLADETPTRITVSLDMQTPGLVVLADRWDEGWNAYLDGTLQPILRTNHALRSVVVPAGMRTLQFCYEPSSLARGARISETAALAWGAWVLAAAWIHRRRANRESRKPIERS